MPNPQHELKRAHAALKGGQLSMAVRVCQRLLTDNPRNIDARYLHGRSLAALGRWSEAAAEFRRVLTYRGSFFPAMVDLGIAEAIDGKYDDARAMLEQARTIDPRPAELHFGLGLCFLGSGDYLAAAGAFQSALDRNRQFPDAHNNLGVAYDRQGRLPEAVECFRQAAAIHPAYADAQRNLGDGLSRLGNFGGAIAAFRKAAQLRPADASAQAELGAAQLAAGDFAAAAASLERAHALDAGLAEAPLGLGKLALAAGDTEAAARYFRAAAAAGPAGSKISLDAASNLEELGHSGDALLVLRDAARAQPGNAEIHDALGATLHRSGRLPEALDCYERALAIDEDRPQTLLNCGHALESMGALRRAVARFERALALCPSDASSVGSMLSCAYRLCDWELARRMLSALRALPNGIDALQAFLMLATDLEPAEVAESLKRRAAAAPRPTFPPREPAAIRGANQRLRIAYLSPDFRTHPVAYAIAGVIERHDRQRVAPIAVSLQAGDGSVIESRLRAAFDEFIDAASLSDRDVVKLMHERQIDVAIDLAGLTTGARTNILAMRAAATQINFLGFPGSMGMEFMDFIIADRTVLDDADEPYYAEKVLRMPHSYLPFDDTRPVSAPPGGRQSAGLPAEGFVFCAFNNGFKITREMFDVWMSLLHELPGSVLWLRSMGPHTAANLKEAAVASDVSAERLVFAKFEQNIDAHLARLQFADVFLDTLPYNAHTTAAEALWAGVPVITSRGRSFAGRVGASLLSACGLGELVCSDLAGYRQLALNIARSPSLRIDLRERLRQARSTAPVFDTSRYTRDFEVLLAEAHRRRAGGAAT
jgi:predicted O-linked N-acetylglucosamine transferase (SPINDLY family)